MSGDAYERLVDGCIHATGAEEVEELLRIAQEHRSEIAAAIGPIEGQATRTLHASETRTVQVLSWAPGMKAPPHEHRMWAVISVLAGREDNVFFSRGPTGLDRVSGESVEAGEVRVLAPDVIHAVDNPRDEFVLAIHVYGGDIRYAPRSVWNPLTLGEEPFDWDRVERLMEAFNARQREEAIPFAAANTPRIMMEILRGGLRG